MHAPLLKCSCNLKPKKKYQRNEQIFLLTLSLFVGISVVLFAWAFGLFLGVFWVVLLVRRGLFDLRNFLHEMWFFYWFWRWINLWIPIVEVKNIKRVKLIIVPNKIIILYSEIYCKPLKLLSQAKLSRYTYIYVCCIKQASSFEFEEYSKHLPESLSLRA